MKQSVAILDFGTSKITVLIGSRGANNTICIDGIGNCEYTGYVRGKWRDADRLSYCIGQALSCAVECARRSIQKIYVGVPNEFSRCIVTDNVISLNKKRRVTEQDVAELRASGIPNGDDLSDYTIINMQPVHYTLDNDHKLIEPVGMMSTRLGGRISYIFGRNDFIQAVNAAVSLAGVTETEYLAVSLAEMQFLFDDRRRDRGVILADVGALGTAFTIGRGDGICVQNHSPWGGLRITAALSDKFGISFLQAEKLKHKVILSLESDFIPPESDAPLIMQTEYEVETDGEIKKFSVSEVNTAVRLEIELFARYVQKSLKYCGCECPDFTPLSVTGGGLCTIRGATEYLAECLNRDVEAVKPSQPMLDRASFSSALGIIDMVLNSDEADDGLIDRFRRWFSKRQR